MSKDANLNRLAGKGLLSKRSIMFKNFLGGIAWGVGSVIGATVIVALFISFLKTFNFIPIIGEFITQISQYVEASKFPIR
ncbi:hypothetical protein HYS93_02530 [Candidatus Daviesbacteria bacterium]|nr:hypothetical protein [Candidatus Daviesbacteria bacterium]